MVTNKYRIGLDVSALDPQFKEHAGRGIGRYVRGILEHLPAATQQLEIGRFDHRAFALPAVLDRAVDLLPYGRQTLRQQLCYPLQLGRGQTASFDVLHFPAHMDAPSWSPVPYMVTVLDLIPLVCKDLYAAEVASWRFKFARWLELRAIKNASLILAISECTAKDVQSYLQVPREKIVVTPLGVDAQFFAEPSPAIRLELLERFPELGRRPVLSYVGGIDPRKNVLQLLRIFARLQVLCRERVGARPLLVLVGKIEQDRNYRGLIKLIDSLGIRDDVLLTGFLEDTQLRSVIKFSELFVFPSLYEGFGLPPLEAMALGTPVVAARNSCMPEVLGAAAFWFEPAEIEGAAHTLFELLHCDKSERLARRQSGLDQARKFTWEAAAQATLAAYHLFVERSFISLSS